MDFSGRVEAIHVIPVKRAAPEARERVLAEADLGLVGDCYHGAVKDGVPRPDKAITLVAAESLEAVVAAGIPLAPGETRRNITTRGVPLNDLVGVRFRVGAAVVEGFEWCEPCAHLERLTGKALMKPLLHRAGLRGYVVAGGEIAVGDVIAPL